MDLDPHATYYMLRSFHPQSQETIDSLLQQYDFVAIIKIKAKECTLYSRHAGFPNGIKMFAEEGTMARLRVADQTGISTSNIVLYGAIERDGSVTVF